MGKTLYLQCDSGISGDMVVGALIDLGANEDGLRRALDSLHLGGYQVKVSRKLVSGLDCCDFDVLLDEAHHSHDHDMAYLYDHLDDAAESHDHDHHHHDHGHDHHDQVGHHHHHEHRTYADILQILDAADLAPRARKLAKRIFAIVAEAESKAHGVPVEDVHFHEVGAVDSIVDVVSAAYCLDDLDVNDCVVSPLAEGEGRVRCAHGVLPVPVPAVANIVSAHDLVLSHLHRQGEFVTPTGAAIAAAIRTTDELPASYRIKAVGTGSGKRDYQPVSTVRAMVIEPAESHPQATKDHASSKAESGLYKLETEMDDVTGEALGHVMDLLFQEGAREAHYLPVFMKKGRPGYQVQVLCDAGRIDAIERVLFMDTTTIGIRRVQVDRTALPRREQDVQTQIGPSRVKVATLPTGQKRAYPEYEAVSSLARQAGVSYQDAFRATMEAATE